MRGLSKRLHLSSCCGRRNVRFSLPLRTCSSHARSVSSLHSAVASCFLTVSRKQFSAAAKRCLEADKSEESPLEQSTLDPKTQALDKNVYEREYVRMIREHSSPDIAKRVEELMNEERYLKSLLDRVKQLSATHREQRKQFEAQKCEGTSEKPPVPEWAMDSGLTLQDLSLFKRNEHMRKQAEDGQSTAEKTQKSTARNERFFGSVDGVGLNEFGSLGIDPQLCRAIESLGLSHASHIQSLAIPNVHKGDNCVIASETGSGKTLAYLIPILQRLLIDRSYFPLLRDSDYQPHIARESARLSTDTMQRSAVSDEYVSEIVDKQLGGGSAEDGDCDPLSNFAIWAEKKYPTVVILQPNMHLVNQCETVLNQLLKAYYAQVAADKKRELIQEWRLTEASKMSRRQILRAKQRAKKEGTNSSSKQQTADDSSAVDYLGYLQPPKALLHEIESEASAAVATVRCMSVVGKTLLPSSNSLMPDIVIATPSALLSNIHKKHSERRFFGFLSRIRCVVLDEADAMVSTQLRNSLRYVFAKLSELQVRVCERPLKTVELLPSAVRSEMQEKPALVFSELAKMGSPQMVFVGATIPTKGQRTVAQTIRRWLQGATWIRTPGLHEPLPHIEQEFRFVPLGSNRRALRLLMNQLAQEHLDRRSMEEAPVCSNGTGNEQLPTAEKDSETYSVLPKGINSGGHSHLLKVLIFTNTKREAMATESLLKRDLFLNTHSISSGLDRDEQSARLNAFLRGANVSKASEMPAQKRGVHVLVASDTMARGVDFRDVDVVVNMDFPMNAVSYLHRAGRTGRGALGLAHNSASHGKVISFFAECDLDLAWHLQVSLLNYYEQMLREAAADCGADADFEARAARSETQAAASGQAADGGNNSNNNKGRVVRRVVRRRKRKVPQSTEQCPDEAVCDQSEEQSSESAISETDASGDMSAFGEGFAEDSSQIGTKRVRFRDLFAEKRVVAREMKNPEKGYVKMSAPRWHESRVDLTRIDFEDADAAVVEAIVGNLKAPEFKRQKLKAQASERKEAAEGNDDEIIAALRETGKLTDEAPAVDSGEAESEGHEDDSEPSIDSLLRALPKAKDAQSGDSLLPDLEQMIASGRLPRSAWRVPFSHLQLDFSQTDEGDDEKDKN